MKRLVATLTFCAMALSTPVQANNDNEYYAFAEAVFSTKDLPTGFAKGLMRLESDTGRAMTSYTGCKGWYQFCEGTARQYGLDDPNDLVDSTYAAASLGADNMKSLTIYNVPITRFNLFMAHNIGPKNAQSVWKTVRGMYVNPRLRMKMVKQIRHNWPKSILGKMPANPTTVAKKYHKHFFKLFESLAR